MQREGRAPPLRKVMHEAIHIIRIVRFLKGKYQCSYNNDRFFSKLRYSGSAVILHNRNAKLQENILQVSFKKLAEMY